MNPMDRKISSALAHSPQGHAYYCTCKNRVNLRFKERWFEFDRGEFVEFRQYLSRLIGNKPLMTRMVEDAVAEAVRRGDSPDRLPTEEDLGEMLGLVDATLLVLEAQDIAKSA